MKIAIVVPSHIPYMRGGLEKHSEDLFWNMNRLTRHEAEIIKIPAREETFWDLIDAYHFFYNYSSLSHFDQIITMKYPCWMIQHPNHVVWMVHKLRGLYDTYGFNGVLGKEIRDYIDNFLEDIPLFSDQKDCERLFSRLYNNRNEIETMSGLTLFPGPFIKEIVARFDNFALHPFRIKKYFSNSNTVKNRDGYFMVPSRVEVLYPPLGMGKRFSKNVSYGDYFFTVSRLDGPKRVGLIIELFKKCPSLYRLMIAGDGPEMDKLRRLAAGDERISLLGRVTNKKRDALYRGCRATIFMPDREDFGYITEESFAQKKAVVTLDDAGGVCELVENNISGFVLRKDNDLQKSFNRAIKKLGDVRVAKKMGSGGFERVRGITWAKVMSKVINEDDVLGDDNNLLPQKRIFVVAPFVVYPPVGGGQQRIFNIYGRFKEYRIVFVCVSSEIDKYGIGQVTEQEILPGMKQVVITPGKVFMEKFWKLSMKFAGISVFDIACLLFSRDLPRIFEYIKEFVGREDVVVINHPYVYGADFFSRLKCKVVYEAQNIECVLKSSYINDKKIIDIIRKTEEKLARTSGAIISCSEEINKWFKSTRKIIYAPNGVDTKKWKFINIEERRGLQKAVGKKRPMVVFIGSDHPPNIDSVKFIMKVARLLPSVTFVIVGSVANNEVFRKREKDLAGKNVVFTGVLDDEKVFNLLSIGDVAVNPMFIGSGSNLKLLTYFSVGIPVITTKFGKRGFEMKNGACVTVDNRRDQKMWAEKIIKLVGEKKDVLVRMTQVAWKISEKYDWDNVAGASEKGINSLYKG